MPTENTIEEIQEESNSTTESQEENTITYLDDDQIKEFIKDGSKIVFLYMPNSSPSQFQEERLHQIYEGYGDKVSIGMVDVLTNQKFAISNKIRSFPSTLFFKDNELIFQDSGVLKDIENAVMRIL